MVRGGCYKREKYSEKWGNLYKKADLFFENPRILLAGPDSNKLAILRYSFDSKQLDAAFSFIDLVLEKYLEEYLKKIEIK